MVTRFSGGRKYFQLLRYGGERGVECPIHEQSSTVWFDDGVVVGEVKCANAGSERFNSGQVV